MVCLATSSLFLPIWKFLLLFESPVPDFYLESQACLLGKDWIWCEQDPSSNPEAERAWFITVSELLPTDMSRADPTLGNFVRIRDDVCTSLGTQ